MGQRDRHIISINDSSVIIQQIYINPLLDILASSGFGGHIGNINCCAPTCADDLAIISSCPIELKILIDITNNYSKREAYTLQPTKSVILPVKTAPLIDIPNEIWSIDDKPMPVVNKTTHIGIQKSEHDTAKITVEENIKKARRVTYSLMGTGLHGRNGLDPVTIISILKTYILPILTYGLEIVLPEGINLQNIDLFYKNLLKQLLTLTRTIAVPAIYILSGLLPIEAEIHKKALTLFGNISRSDHDSAEWKIAERQLSIKTSTSHSWFINVKKLCIKYDIPDCKSYLYEPVDKLKWKIMIRNKIERYWSNKINHESCQFSTINAISGSYVTGKVHPLLKTNSANTRDIARIPIRVKVSTGTYILQANRAKFNKAEVSPYCKLCNKDTENIKHFISECEKLEVARKDLTVTIQGRIDEFTSLFDSKNKYTLEEVIINPYQLVTCIASDCVSSCKFIDCFIEPACRALIYSLHNHRYKLLGMIFSEPIVSTIPKDAVSPTIQSLYFTMSRAMEYCNWPQSLQKGEEGEQRTGYVLKLVHVFIRHGARTSMHSVHGIRNPKISCKVKNSFDMDNKLTKLLTVWKRKFKNFGFGNYFLYPQSKICGASSLTPYGMQQHIMTGQYLKSRYADFLNYSIPHVRSTDTSRTYQSAVAFLLGFLNETNLENVKLFKSGTVSFCSEQLSSMSCSCPRASNLLEKAKTKTSLFERNNIYKGRISEKLSKLLGFGLEDSVLTFPVLDSLSTYVCHNVSLPCFPLQNHCLSKLQIDEIFYTEDKIGRFMTRDNTHYTQFAHLYLHPILTEMAVRMRAVTRNKNKESFVLYSGHDVTITPLLVLFGIHSGKWPPFASRLVIELYEQAGSKRHFAIKVLYNGKDMTSLVTFCRNKSKNGFCKLKYFLDFAKDHLEDMGMGSYDDACDL